MIGKNTHNAANWLHREAEVVLAESRLDSIYPVSLTGVTLSPLPENYGAHGFEQNG